MMQWLRDELAEMARMSAPAEVTERIRELAAMDDEELERVLG